MSITTRPFGQDATGRVMTLYTMTNASGASVSVTDFGAHVVSICVPDGYGGANIISGVIDNGAINDLHLASCDMKKAGQHVILMDDDGYSSTTTWSPGNDE